MHPILARGSRLALYLGLWVLVSALLAQLMAGRVGLSWRQAALVALPAALVYAFVCLSAWYVARSLPIKTTGTWRILLTGLVTSLLSSAVWLAIAGFWLSLLVTRGWLPASARSGGHQSLIFGFGVLLYLLSFAVGYLLVMFEENRAADRRALEVQVFAREAELRSLRSQLDPHFLFNCLHSISALTTADPPGARRMCLLLAEFLRETLRARRREPHHARARAGAGRPVSRGRADPLRRPPRRRADRRPDAAGLPRAAAAAAAAGRERGHARHRAPARRRDDSHRRLAHARAPARSSSRTRATRTVRAAPAPAWAGERARAPARALRRRGASSTAPNGEASARMELSVPVSTEANERGRIPCAPSSWTTRRWPAASCASISARIPGSRSSPSARNGFEAVKAVTELAPDLLFLDVQMPKLDGFEVLELLGRGVAGDLRHRLRRVRHARLRRARRRLPAQAVQRRAAWPQALAAGARAAGGGRAPSRAPTRPLAAAARPRRVPLERIARARRGPAST